ncbi:hypothetical protein HMN09_01189100 [Mycena chlorophos]|uniref:Uncharacterized protein n=1 Tax=Mycena chlorophos TaxID=658473 RepID=A0A8H6VU13_MYCCL|nr:hypothetical protein HMN09_01189100 [Mycena chlorophos]
MAPNAAGRSATDLCPTELWEQILAELCDDSDDLLLGPISQSCRDLRGLAVWMALQRHGLTLDVLGGRVLRLPTGLALRALAMHLASRRPTPLNAAELNVQCGYQEIPALALLIRTLPHLTSLQIILDADLLSPEITIRNRGSVITEMRRLLAEIAGRQEGRRVVVVLDGQTFSCRAGDVALWALERYEYNPPPKPLISKLVSRRRVLGPSTRPPTTKTRSFGGEYVSVQTLDSLDGLRLRLVGSNSQFSLLTLGNPKTLWLGHSTLRYQWAQHVTPPDLAPFLDDIASNGFLPHLTELHLHLEEDTISPGALRTLLANNPTLQGIFYHGASRPAPERTLLLDAPLVHPSLAAIHTSSSLLTSAEPTARLVPALIDSPKLVGFSFTFRAYHNANDGASGLLTDLKAIAGCGREGIVLFLNHLESGLSTFWSESREAIDTARLFSAPRCVLSKIYTTTNEVSTAHRLLPWLAAMRPQAPVNAHFKLVLSDRVQAGFGSAQTSESKRRAIERGLLDEAGKVLQGDNWTVTVTVVFSGFGADTISFA